MEISISSNSSERPNVDNSEVFILADLVNVKNFPSSLHGFKFLLKYKIIPVIIASGFLVAMLTRMSVRGKRCHSLLKFSIHAILLVGTTEIIARLPSTTHPHQK